MRFQLNSPDVIQESIDGEVIVVHLVSGSYYSLLGAGVTLWNALLAGHDDQTLADFFDPPPDPLAVASFVSQLQSEELLVPSSAPEITAAAPLTGGSFSPPVLQKFSDMQELLLVDPIHEVKAEGWPLTNSQGTAEA
jgi:hypothetical protein